MSLTVILLFAGVAIAFLLWRAGAKSRGEAAKMGDGNHNSAPRRHESNAPGELRIQDVRAGGVLSMAGVGPDMDDFDVQVISRHIYRQGSSRWFELECDRGGNKVWLDIEDDDDLELAIAVKKLKLPDIDVTSKDLERMDDDERGQINYNGKVFRMDDSDRAEFCRDGDESNPEDMYYWDFETKAGDEFIGVERWSDGSFSVTLSHKVKPFQITVFSVSGPSS